jgi:hypothetical protein
MTMSTTHGISNAFTDELLKYLSSTLLPKGNYMPNSFYHAKMKLRKIGLQYNSIHCCPDGHVLFRGDMVNLDACPHPGCGLSRWLPGSTIVPAKVLRHFPLIPRLKRMFRSPAIAKLLRWAAENKTGTDEMRSVADSPAWDHIDREIDRDFAIEKRHLRMALSLDGLNPFSMQRSTHSTWPVMILIYNLPPWLLTKRFFVSLCLLISSKDSPTSENIDVFLAPLVEELLELWDGVDTFDASARSLQEGSTFKIRAILMWTISDFPVYGLISGLCTKAFLACPICGPNTISRTAKEPKKYKQVFLGARRWTRRNHLFRRNLRFNGHPEHGSAPPRQSAGDVLRSAQSRLEYLQGMDTGRPGRPDGPLDPYRRLGVRRRSVLFDLPYWQVKCLLFLSLSACSYINVIHMS